MIKQVIVVRKDLKMPVGKIAAQVAHASMKATLENLEDFRVVEWLDGDFTKVVVGCSDEEELCNIYTNALQHDLIAAVIVDNGKTVFKNIPTLTCVAIGPDTPENIDKITGHLKLLR